MSSNSHPKNPFKGLRPFKQEEQEQLFGRDRDLILMKDRILSSRTTLLFAGSGVGKTSFLNAKVIPALKERYCVIWHNRWTGAYEGKDGSWDDRPPFAIWPPKVFGRWLAEAVFERAWLHRRLSKKDKTALQITGTNNEALPSEEEIARRQVEAAVQSVISQSLRAGDKKPLSQELAGFKRRPAGENQLKPCILILDQFEEVFQYHAYENYFKDFISDLAEVINNDDYQVRVVFSMREEFLGELSAFDNHVPDLFNNYYRLRHPEIDEARDIIEKTCDLVKVEPHADNLGKLVNDLASIQKNFEITDTPSKGEKRPVRVLRRGFVPPPYLQIVCDSLWKEQYEKLGTTVESATNGGTKKGIGLFLENYKAGSEKPVDGEESDAQRAVRVFCETKLSPPFLKKWEQNVAARAFGFLVTKQGAKMAYELRSLASHMDERVWALKHVLHKLSEPEARILRESRGPEGSYWFELYHDMYAGVVDRWKRKFRKEKSRRNTLIVAAVVLAAVMLPVVGIFWIKVPYDDRQTLENYRDTLREPDVEKDQDNFANALSAYNQLRSTYGYYHVAHSLWAQIWQRRAQLYEAQERRDEALMCLLQAAALVKNRAEESEYLAQANNLFVGNEPSIQATFCTECRVSSVSPGGDLLLTIGTGGIVNLWDIKNRRYSSTVCPACEQAVFSTDGKSIATVSSLKDLANKSNQPGERTGQPEERPGAANSATERTREAQLRSAAQAGWTVTISSVDSSLPPLSFNVMRLRTGGSDDLALPRFLLRSVAKTKEGGYLVAGIVDNRLKVWRGENGSVFADVNVAREIQQGYSALLRADFDRDARFLATGGSVLNTTLWEVREKGLVPSKITNLSDRRLYAFSSDGRHFLSATAKKDVGLWDLANQKQVLSLIPAPRLYSLGFAVGSGKFFVAQDDSTVQVWDSNTRQPVSEPLAIAGGFTRVLLDGHGKNVVIRNSGLISKWSVESRRLVGELQIQDRQNGGNFIFGGNLTPEGSFLGLSDSSVRLWDIPALEQHDTFGGEKEEEFSFGGFSPDGNSMLTLFEDIWGDSPTTFHIWNIPQKTKVEFAAHTFAYATISTSTRVALIPNENRTKVRMFGVDGEPEPRLSFDAQIKSVFFNHSGSVLAAVTNTNEVRLIDTSTNKVRLIDTSTQTLRTLPSNLNIASVEFAPNGDYLVIKAAPAPVAAGPATAAQSTDTSPFESESFHDIEVWSLSRFDRIVLDRDRNQPVTMVGFGGSRLFTIQNKRLEVWDLPDGRKVKDKDLVGNVLSAAMSADGNLVAVGDAKGRLQLIDIQSATRGSAITLGSPVGKIIFAPDGRSLVAITESWFHNLAITPDEMRYSEGIFAPNAVADSLRFLSKTVENSQTSIPNIQWIRKGRGGWGVRKASFEGEVSDPVLKGDPDELLKEWSQRLGLQIQSSGSLAPNSPRLTPSSST